MEKIKEIADEEHNGGNEENTEYSHESDHDDIESIFNDLGSINLKEAEDLANEGTVFLTENDLFEGLEDFDLIPLEDNFDIDKNDHSSIENAAKTLLHDRDNKMVMITLSEAGVFIADQTQSYSIPAHIRDISDVSGAGDTVISVASLALAAQLPIKVIAEMSNLAGGLVCEIVGVAPIDKKQLLSECEQLSLLTSELKNS